MQGIRVEFEWTRFADYGVEENPGTPGSLLSEIPNDQLVALGSPKAALRTRPLEMFPGLYLELAQSKPMIAGHKEFAKKYGLLTHPKRESTSIWPQLVENIRNLVALVGDKGRWEVRDGKYVPYVLPSKFNLQFGPTNGGGTDLALSIVPANLYNALVWQCLSNRVGGSEVRSCRACGAPFEIGGASGHRSNREFCSDKCRFDFNHRIRRKEQ
jgi:hypothetical protein